jgi:hypothetical protein
LSQNTDSFLVDKVFVLFVTSTLLVCVLGKRKDDDWLKRCTRLEVLERDPEVDQGKRG